MTSPQETRYRWQPARETTINVEPISAAKAAKTTQERVKAAISRALISPGHAGLAVSHVETMQLLHVGERESTNHRFQVQPPDYMIVALITLIQHRAANSIECVQNSKTAAYLIKLVIPTNVGIQSKRWMRVLMK